MWQEISLTPPCSNLRSFGSKCSVLKKVLATLLGLFGTRDIVLPFTPSLRPWLSAVFCSGLLTWSAYVPYNDTLYTKE